MIRRQPTSPPFPTPPLFRSGRRPCGPSRATAVSLLDVPSLSERVSGVLMMIVMKEGATSAEVQAVIERVRESGAHAHVSDRKSTRLNSSHANISYAVFCLKK